MSLLERLAGKIPDSQWLERFSLYLLIHGTPPVCGDIMSHNPQSVYEPTNISEEACGQVN